MAVISGRATKSLGVIVDASANVKQSSPWAAAAAACFLTWLQWPLLNLYGLVHWGALFKYGEPLPEVFQPPLLQALSNLDQYRAVIAVAGFSFAVWATFSKPRWIGAIAIVAALVGCVQAFMVTM